MRVCVCAVFIQVRNDDVEKAVQEHRLLLKTLSRSSSVELLGARPADDCVSVTAFNGTTLHVNVAVSYLLMLMVMVLVVVMMV